MKNNLCKNLLFTGVDDEYGDKVIDQLIEMMVSAEISKGETLMREGDVGDAFYYFEKQHFSISVQRFYTDFIHHNWVIMQVQLVLCQIATISYCTKILK